MMKKRITWLVSLLFIVALAGCATTGQSSSAGEDASDETPGYEFEEIEIAEFVLGVGDTIDIRVYRHEDLTRNQKIGSGGIFMYPLIGDVKVSGKGVFALRDEMRTRLSKYIVDPQISISVSEVKSQKVMVLGEVSNPGVYTLDTATSLFESITKAGGPTDDAKLRNVVLVRSVSGKQNFEVFDVKKAYSGEGKATSRMLVSGDIIYVPDLTIAKVSWFFGHLSRILAPITSSGSGIVVWDNAIDILRSTDDDAVSGGNTPITIPAN